MDIPRSVLEVAAGERPPREGRQLVPVVTEHRINWYPKTWFDDERLHWAAGRIAELAEICGGSVVQRQRTTISRLQVFEQFRTADPLQAFLAGMIWGYGTYVRRGRPRLARIRNENADFALKLERLIDTSRQGDAGSAWDAFTGENRIAYLGPAFATKVAYFAAFAEGPPSSAAPPLIADSLVNLALDEPGVTLSRDVYVAYTESAAAAAVHITDIERARPDQIELALFDEGWHLRKEKRNLHDP